MLQDFRNQRPTEIDSINGYIVKQGKQLNIPTPANMALAEEVSKHSYKELLA